MQKTWVQSLGWEDPLEKEMAAHSSILAWRLPWTDEPGGQHTHASQDFYFRAFYLFYSILILNNRSSAIFALK